MVRHNADTLLDFGEPLEPALPQPEASPAVASLVPQAGRADIQFGLGNAQLAAAAASGSPPDPTKILPLQLGFGNAAVSRSLIQRKADDSNAAASSNAASPAAPTDTTGTTPPATTPTQGLIVEDDAETVQPEQMKKSVFLAQLRSAVTNTVAEVAAGSPLSATASPQIESVFAQYSGQSGRQLEATIRRQVPGAAGVNTAAGFIQAIVGQVRRSLQEGVPSSLTGAVGAIGNAVSSAASAVVEGVGSVLSGIGSLFLKARNDGAREINQEPEAIQSQLGAGQSLDAGVRSRMESAYGQSFSSVEVHTDTNAVGLSENLNARAFTVGQHIAFGASEYQPGTLIGDALIAHELAHVVQQNGVGASAAPAQKGATEYGSLEEDADAAAVGAVVSAWGGAGKGLARITKSALPSLKSGLRLQRCASDESSSLGRANPEVTGKYLGTWKETVSSSKITGGVEIAPPGKTPGALGDGFDTYQDALAYAQVGIAGAHGQGGVIIQKDGRYRAFTITLDSWVYDFTRENLEAIGKVNVFDVLDISKSEVKGIQAFVTQDGYAAKPGIVVNRRLEEEGSPLQSTKDPEASGYKTMLGDIAAGRKTGMTEQEYVALFKGLLKANALRQLEENRKLLIEEEKKYQNPKTEDKQWQRLRQVIEKDREFAKYQDLYHEKYFEMNKTIGYFGTGIATMPGGDEMMGKMHAYGELEEQAKQARNSLRVQYPALAVLKTEDVPPEQSNKEVLTRMSGGFKEVQEAITDVYKKIHEEDMPLSKLGPLVKQTEAEMGVSEEKRKSGDPMSQAVLGWLDTQDTKEAIISIGGTILSIVLAVGALVATIASAGLAALVLGLGGAIAGLGTAAYEFDRAEDLYAAARAGTGGKQLVDDPEAARFNYIMGWVNLVLAGLDLGLSAKAGTTMLKGARAAEKLAGTVGSDVLKTLKAEQIVQFDKAMQLRRAGKAAEAEEILGKLKKALGEETFTKASNVFGRASAVEELFGASAKVSQNARDALRNVNEALLRELSALGEEAVESVGAFIHRSGPQAAHFLNELGDDALQMIVKSGGKVGGEADAALKVFNALGAERLRPFLKLGLTNPAILSELEKAAELLTSRRLMGLEDWLVVNAKKAPAELANAINELRAARRLANENPQSVIHLGQEVHAPLRPGTDQPMKSFDIAVKSPTGAVERSVEVTSVKKKIEVPSDISEGVRHATEKAAGRKTALAPIPGALDAEIQIELLSEQAVSGGTIKRASDGTVSLITGKNVIIPKGNIFDKFVVNISSIKDNELLDRIILVSQDDIVLAVYERIGDIWKRVR